MCNSKENQKVEFLEIDEEQSIKLEAPVTKTKSKDRVFDVKESIKTDILKATSGIGQIEAAAPLPPPTEEKPKIKKRRGKIKRARRKRRKPTREKTIQSNQDQGIKNRGKK